MPGASSLMSAVAGSFGAPVADSLGAVDRMKRSERTSMTSVDFNFRSMRIARPSRVNSSMTFNMRNFLPSWVRSSTKS